MDNVSILLVGIGGFGYFYADALLNVITAGVDIAGVVDVRPESCPLLDKIKARKIPIYNSMEKFYACHTADLAIISTPIHFHTTQTCYALEHGSHVLCEKPAAATIQEVEKMMKARDKAGKFVAIGYQWSYSNAILNLKRDVMSGALGRPKRCKTLVLWPRNDEYFKRGWAGRKYDDNGTPILDSIIHNAAAHYLHNMLHVLGDSVNGSLRPDFITAELYRANNIQNFDTVAMRAISEKGVEIIYFGSHAVNDLLGPDFCFEFENATISYIEKNGNSSYDIKAADPEREIKAIFKDGSVKSYGNPYNHHHDKIHAALKAVRDGAEIPCGLEASASQVLCINGIQDSMPDIVDFPRELVVHDEDLYQKKSGYRVNGLEDVLKECYGRNLLPSEMGVSWAKAGKAVDLRYYKEYKGNGKV